MTEDEPQTDAETEKEPKTGAKDTSESQATSQLDLGDFKVLIVEDFPFIAALVATCLREMGVGKVVTAEHGKTALTKIQSMNQFENDNNIDVVILDWLMPEMDGRQLLKAIRTHKSDSIRFLPVIVCSAYTSETLVKESRDLGANEVVVKPISAGELARRIQYVINNPRPYVKNQSFFGPDRRRQKRPFEGKDKRVNKPQDIKNNHEQN
ncbi:MAG: response regulator [Alphaproteobacteria bacterium]|nr:response regulator [Alphaproteobacteria bacterium]